MYSEQGFDIVGEIIGLAFLFWVGLRVGKDFKRSKKYIKNEIEQQNSKIKKKR